MFSSLSHTPVSVVYIVHLFISFSYVCLLYRWIWFMGIKMIGQNKITDFVDCILFMLYYPSNCEFESHSRRVHSMQHYVIKFVSDLSLRQVSSNKKSDRHDITEILKSGVKHHQTNLQIVIILLVNRWYCWKHIFDPDIA